MKTWWNNWKRRRQRERWEFGFCWTVGQILLEQETEYSIRHKVDECAVILGKLDAFDRGCLEALKLLKTNNLI